MRHGSSGRRQRNRGGSNRGNGGGNNRMQVYDSNGPDVRIRGTAHQVVEKYLALAKDANGSGDIVMEQNYLQHAEHYQRIVNSWGEGSETRTQGDNQEKSGRKPRQNGRDAPEKTPDKNSDLSLPASILGDDVQSVSEEKAAEAV